MTVHQANLRLIDDLKRVLRDAEDLLQATSGEAGANVRAIRGRLIAALEPAKAACARLQEQTARAAERTDHLIRDHPYETLGIAFGVGMLIGVLLMRQ